MPLNTWVAGDPASARATSAWMRSMAENIRAAGAGANNAGATSMEGWSGQSAEAFRQIMSQSGKGMDDLGFVGYSSGADALDAHAADLETVKARMQQARDVAAQGGLTLTEKEILEPGPPPPDPPPVSGNGPETPAQAGARAQMVAAKEAYARQVKAWTEATLTVSGSRDIENNSIDVLLSYLTNVGEKWHINAADFGTGLAAATLAQKVKFTSNAQYFKNIAAESFKIADDVGMTAAQRAHMIIQGTKANAKSLSNLAKGEAAIAGKFLERMPPWVKTIVLGELDKIAKTPGLNKIPGLERAMPALKKIPIAGTALTGGSVLIDISQKKDPTTSVVSNLGGLGAGVLVGAAVGGPVGAAAGFLVSTGTGWAIETFMSEESQRVLDQINKPEVQDNLPWHLRNPLR
ncbi:hypothetical protein [Amycolatopsis nigrescens]|uniref:hypothetical protein n=1 Tax=Amycolatopsis nigrescens TaxID=381445 RepID=UPI000381AFF4|nr:hypothetical protein [Amycolatopsis nigrescens]